MQPVLPANRIAYVCHRSLPDNDTASLQVVQTAAALVRAGAVVDLLIPRKPWRSARPLAWLRRELSEHFQVACGFGIRELPTRIVPDWLAHAIHAAVAGAAVRGGAYAVVHTRDLETAWLCAKLGHPVLYENHRPLTRRSAFFRRQLLGTSARDNFLGLVTHSAYIRDRYLEDGFPPEKIRVIYNGFDPAPFQIRRTPSEARGALGLAEGPTVVYAGRIAALKRIDLLLDAAERAPEIRWVLAGEHTTAEAQPFVRRGATLPNVCFTGYLKGERLTLALQAAEILVMSPAVDALKRPGQSGLPIKVFQYLAAERAILTGDLPDTAELLVHDRNCVRMRPDAVDELVGAVRALAADPARRERLARAAHDDVAALTWDARARALLAFLQERAAARR